MKQVPGGGSHAATCVGKVFRRIRPKTPDMGPTRQNMEQASMLKMTAYL